MVPHPRHDRHAAAKVQYRYNTRSSTSNTVDTPGSRILASAYHRIYGTAHWFVGSTGIRCLSSLHEVVITDRSMDRAWDRGMDRAWIGADHFGKRTQPRNARNTVSPGRAWAFWCRLCRDRRARPPPISGSPHLLDLTLLITRLATAMLRMPCSSCIRRGSVRRPLAARSASQARAR